MTEGEKVTLGFIIFVSIIMVLWSIAMYFGWHPFNDAYDAWVLRRGF